MWPSFTASGPLCKVPAQTSEEAQRAKSINFDQHALPTKTAKKIPASEGKMNLKVYSKAKE